MLKIMSARVCFNILTTDENMKKIKEIITKEHRIILEKLLIMWACIMKFSSVLSVKLTAAIFQRLSPTVDVPGPPVHHTHHLQTLHVLLNTKKIIDYYK